MNVDMDIMEESIIGEVQKEEHISYFVERKVLWPGARRFLLTVGSLGCR